jgi:hypothetical protein
MPKHGARLTRYLGIELPGPNFGNWRGRDGNDPSFDIAKDADQTFEVRRTYVQFVRGLH